MRRRWVFVLLLVVLIAGLEVRAEGIAHTDITRGAERPLGDDSFYYFSLARHVVSGMGVRSDSINLTTGFQPLWGGLVTAAFALDVHRGIPISQGLGVLIGIVGYLLVFVITTQITGHRLIALVSASLWWLLPTTIQQTISGMETIAATVAALGCFALLQRLYRTPSLRWSAALGLGLGVAVLARVDLGFLAAAIFVALLLIPPVAGKRWQTIFMTGACALLPTLPWIILSLQMGKSPLPESGLAVRNLALYLGDAGFVNISLPVELMAFFRQLDAQFYALKWLDVGLPILAILAVGSVFFLRGLRGQQAMKGTLALWLIGLTIAYTVVLRESWYFNRYVLPVAQVSAVLVLAWWADALLKRSNLYVIRAALAIVIVLASVMVIRDYQSKTYQWIFKGTPASAPLFEVATWLNNQLPAQTRVGAFQSGILGYYSTVPIVNLDGKVNSDARIAMERQAMWDYICAAQIDYVTDWPVIIDDYLKARSQDWQANRLTLIEEFASPAAGEPTQAIYRVNRARCPL